MAPRKSQARTNSSQPPPQPSDYETDAAPPAVDVPLPPPRSNDQLNLSVLRRVYPDLTAVAHVTPYVALYTFNLETHQWEKANVEGTLFICQLTPSPIGAERFCAVIHNRRSLENFYQELTSSDEVEISDPYVILQGGDQVYGIWVFADPPPASTANCRVETANKMMEIAGRAGTSREAKEKEGRDDVREATNQADAASSAPMGRQLSLRELFGQQRVQDAGFSIHDHHSHPTPNLHQQQQGYVPNPGPAQQDVLDRLERVTRESKTGEDNAKGLMEDGQIKDVTQESKTGGDKADGLMENKHGDQSIQYPKVPRFTQAKEIFYNA